MFTSEQTIELVRQLIRINTSNPPGNEAEAVQFLESVLMDHGMDVTVFTPVKGKANLMAKIEGKRHGNPVVLLNHIDVVPARAEQWDMDPFGAEVRDGYIYGRGAIDMKAQTICHLVAFMNIRAEGILPERDILFLATCDEEVGGGYGLKYMLRDVKELRQASFVLSEGGGIIEENGKTTAQIAVSEKRLAQFVVRAAGAGGHGSMPHGDNANEKVVHAAQAILSHQWPMKPTAVVSAYFKGVFEHDASLSVPFTTMTEMVKEKTFRRIIEDNPVYNALLRNTVTLTVLRGGDKVNVIPSVAEAHFDARILPSESRERFFEKIRKLAGDGVTVEAVEQKEDDQPGRSDFRTPWFRGLQAITKRHFGDIPVLPFVTTGATDMRYLRELGITAYGFFPVRISADDLRRMHGVNERISIENLLEGCEVTKEIVRFLAQNV